MELYQVLDEITTKMSNIIKKHKEMVISKSDLISISYGQFIFLHTISALDNPTITTLAKELDLTKPTVTIAVSKLIDSGLVQKVKSAKDGRVYYLNLTSKGQGLSEAEMNAYKEIVQVLKEKLTAEEFHMFQHILLKLL